MSIPSSETLHATTVALVGQAVMIMGLSGSGKSDLALRLIDRGATLVSDDYTRMTRLGDHLNASAPANICGKIEMRGVGIVEMPFLESAPIRLIVALGEPVIRLPEHWERRVMLGVDIPVMPISGFEPSAPIKIEQAMRGLRKG